MIFHNSEFASQMAWLKFAAKTLQDASKTLTRRPKKLADLSQDAPQDALRCFQAPPTRPKTTQDDPKTPQDAPKMAPRRFQDATKTAQEPQE